MKTLKVSTASQDPHMKEMANQLNRIFGELQTFLDSATVATRKTEGSLKTINDRLGQLTEAKLTDLINAVAGGH